MSAAATEPDPADSHGSDLLTLDELTEQVGISVRNIRFYTTRGLLPAPIKRGRSGYYSPDHVARLELVKELQAHGFTLAAIEKYVARIPEESSPDQIAVHRVTLQPWLVEEPRRIPRAKLDAEIGRELTQTQVERLIAMDVLRPLADDRYEIVGSRLSSGLALLDLDVPLDVLAACNDIYTRHGRAIAEELMDVFQRLVWPAYKGGDLPAEHLVRMLEAFQPASVAALVEAFTHAMTDVRRAQAERRTT